MTPEERFARIEITLGALAESQARTEVQIDLVSKRLDKMAEFQAVLMESQNDTWRALKNLSDNVEKLIRFQGRNGHGED